MDDFIYEKVITTPNFESITKFIVVWILVKIMLSVVG